MSVGNPAMCIECGYLHGRHATSCKRQRKTVWVRLCGLAIKRHRVVWRMCGSNPATWPLHEMQIAAVYGIDTFEAALRTEGK